MPDINSEWLLCVQGLRLEGCIRLPMLFQSQNRRKNIYQMRPLLMEMVFGNNHRKERLHPKIKDPHLRDLGREMSEKRVGNDKEQTLSSFRPVQLHQRLRYQESEFQLTFTTTWSVLPSMARPLKDSSSG